jgi:hypothetical protein
MGSGNFYIILSTLVILEMCDNMSILATLHFLVSGSVNEELVSLVGNLSCLINGGVV